MFEYTSKLAESFAVNDSRLCVGLDYNYADALELDSRAYVEGVIDDTIDIVGAYKINLAFYEMLGVEGMCWLDETICYIRAKNPKIQIIGDAKRADIGPSGEAYARALFEAWDFDAVTVNPWGGWETVTPFLSYANKGVYVWCHSSGEGRRDIQRQRLFNTGEALYVYVARKLHEINSNGNLGLVLGGMNKTELGVFRIIYPDTPFLIPGIGAQGGNLRWAVLSGIGSRDGQSLISVSRSIVYPEGGWEKTREAAMGYNQQINKYRQELGVVSA